MPKKIREICKKHFSKNLVPWIKKYFQVGKCNKTL